MAKFLVVEQDPMQCV